MVACFTRISAFRQQPPASKTKLSAALTILWVLGVAAYAVYLSYINLVAPETFIGFSSISTKSQVASSFSVSIQCQHANGCLACTAPCTNMAGRTEVTTGSTATVTLPFYLMANTYSHNGAGWDLGAVGDLATIDSPDGNVITISTTDCNTVGCNSAMIQYTQKRLIGSTRFEYSPSDSDCVSSVRQAGETAVSHPGMTSATGFVRVLETNQNGQGNTVGSATYTTVCMNSAVIVLKEQSKAIGWMEMAGALGGFACGLMGALAVLAAAADDKKWWAPCLLENTSDPEVHGESPESEFHMNVSPPQLEEPTTKHPM